MKPKLTRRRRLRPARLPSLRAENSIAPLLHGLEDIADRILAMLFQLDRKLGGNAAFEFVDLHELIGRNAPEIEMLLGQPLQALGPDETRPFGIEQADRLLFIDDRGIRAGDLAFDAAD